MFKIDLEHVLAWPPQPSTLAGMALVLMAIALPELAVPAVAAGLVAIVGDDGSHRRQSRKVIKKPDEKS